MVPPGIWCWLFSELVFLMMCMLISLLANIASAWMNKKHEKLAHHHDRVLRVLLPVELCVGMLLILLFKEHHALIIFGFMIPIVGIFHLIQIIHFCRLTSNMDDGSDDDCFDHLCLFQWMVGHRGK